MPKFHLDTPRQQKDVYMYSTNYRFKSLILSIHYTCPIPRVYGVFGFKIFRICDIEEALALSLKLAAA